jgi:hypothetical protein
MPKNNPGERHYATRKDIVNHAPNELKAIQQAIAELQERAKMVVNNTKERVMLLAYARRHKLNRADLKWAYDQMPKLRISTADREARQIAKAKPK